MVLSVHTKQQRLNVQKWLENNGGSNVNGNTKKKKKKQETYPTTLTQPTWLPAMVLFWNPSKKTCGHEFFFFSPKAMKNSSFLPLFSMRVASPPFENLPIFLYLFYISLFFSPAISHCYISFLSLLTSSKTHLLMLFVAISSTSTWEVFLSPNSITSTRKVFFFFNLKKWIHAYRVKVLHLPKTSPLVDFLIKLQIIKSNK